MNREINNIWDFLSWLWFSVVDFLNIRISGFGLDISLWELAIGFAVLWLVLYCIFRTLD